MTDRDTKFLGFAKLLLVELDTAICEASTEENGVVDGCFMCNASPEQAAQVLAPLIARRAYDLVEHTIDSLWLYINDDAIEPTPSDISDLTQWPD